MPNLADHVRNNPPYCIAEVDQLLAAPIDRRSEVAATYSLAQRGTGSVAAQVLGYPLADYNPTCVGDIDFISPLKLRWPDSQENVVFDSQIHGYHGQMDSSAKLRGKGLPKTFACPGCGSDRFAVSIQFDYWDSCNDLWEDEPDLPIQDYFNNVLLTGKCQKCGMLTRVLDMDL